MGQIGMGQMQAPPSLAALVGASPYQPMHPHNHARPQTQRQTSSTRNCSCAETSTYAINHHIQQAQHSTHAPPGLYEWGEPSSAS